VSTQLQHIKSRVHGIVFDSCPGHGLDRLADALAHTTWQERATAAWRGGFMNFFLMNCNSRQQILKRRSETFYSTLLKDTWDVPQLYLYSEDDLLAPYHHIDFLVRHRQGLFGNDHVQFSRWTTSKHCAHLLCHPEEYEAAITAFTTACFPRSRL
jgi:pimeloyl-ACP methyl ester carboxylesterase